MSDTSQDSVFLVHVGQVIYWNVASLIVTCIAYGFNLLAGSIAVYLFVKNGTRGVARKALLTLTLVIMLSTTWDVINRAGLYLTQIDYILMRPLSGGILAQAVAANQATVPYEYVDGWPVTINLGIGLNLLRYSLASDRRRYRLVEGMGNLSSQHSRAGIIDNPDARQHRRVFRTLAIFLFMVGCSSHIPAVNISDVIMEDVNPSGQTHSLAMDTASVWVSLGVNAFATSIVALKMFRHRRSVRIISRKGSMTSVEKLLLFLVESGSAFCAFQVLFAIFDTLNLYQTTTTDSPIQITTLILYSIFNGFTVLYPLAVIIMVSLNSSVIEASIHMQGPSSSGLLDSPPIRTDTKVSTMQFASGPTSSASHASITL
ncbi:hypothetical protein F5890DRAFT_1477335 [Lentinula detonsa]|uniref:Uncharacterized protein n=1 Tax=Lentinula detonsa TaxID=2804962 RepID=A0AA38PS90_9AGAR|nr:hypothetical protein F5890DRAFT_1477335 [Lentinula detonsa]